MTLLMSSWTRTARAMAEGERGSSLCWLVEEPSPLLCKHGNVCVRGEREGEGKGHHKGEGRGGRDKGKRDMSRGGSRHMYITKTYP